MADRVRSTPFRVQKYLGGLRYPADKPQILERAREKGADDETLHALHRLPEREHSSPIALSCEVGRVAVRRRSLQETRK
jgi:Protein of unknown function (DUF2795)